MSTPTAQDFAARRIAEQMTARHGEGTPDLEQQRMCWSTCPRSCCEYGSVWVAASGAVGCEGCGAGHAELLEALGLAPGASAAEGVVVPLTRDTAITTPLPFSGGRSPDDLIRVVDMAGLLSRPEEPIRWAIEGFAQRGALTVLAGRSGSSKSWLGIEACASVQAGRPFLGLDVEQGPAVYVDGEMGARTMAGRFRAGHLAPDAFTYADVTGLDLGTEAGCAALGRRLSQLGASFVVVDSLRRLTPGKRENDSDDMAPVLGRLAVLARTLDCAVLLLHHAGWGEDRAYRGSTAIGDQADAVFTLERVGDALRLSCNPERGCKMRGAEEPPDRWLRRAVGEQRGVVVVSASPPAITAPLARMTAAAQMAVDLRELFTGTTQPVRKRDAAAGLAVAEDNQNFRRAWRELVDDGAIVQVPDGWVRAESVPHAPAATSTEAAAA